MREAPPPVGSVPAEEIVEFTWSSQGVIRIMVAQGTKIGDRFVPNPSSNYDQYTVMWEDFEEFMESVNKDESDKGRGIGAMFIEDLWVYVDRCRQQTDANTKREIARRLVNASR